MRIESLTFLRFVAALIVVIFHFGSNTDIVRLAPHTLTSGPQMVTFFYVLSGFVMVLAYANKSEFSASRYYINRFARIAPVYFFALMLSVIITAIKTNKLALLLNMTFLQSWVPPYPLTINPPGWSLSVEAFFYATFPLLFIFISSRKFSWRTLFTVSLLLWLATQIILTFLINTRFYRGFPSPSHDIIYYFPLSHYCSFFLGIAGGYLFINNKERIYAHRYATFLFLLFFAAILAALEKGPELPGLIRITPPIGSSFWAPLYLGLIISISASENFLIGILASAPFVVLGESSYALYILQHPIHVLYEKWLSGKITSNVSLDFYIFVLTLTITSVASCFTLESYGKKTILKAFEVRKRRA